MTASLKSEETSQDENVSQGNQIVQKRFFYILDKIKKCNVIIITFFLWHLNKTQILTINSIFGLNYVQIIIQLITVRIQICLMISFIHCNRDLLKVTKKAERITGRIFKKTFIFFQEDKVFKKFISA